MVVLRRLTDTHDLERLIVLRVHVYGGHLINVNDSDIEHRSPFREIREPLTDHVVLALERRVDPTAFSIENHGSEMALDMADGAQGFPRHVGDKEPVRE